MSTNSNQNKIIGFTISVECHRCGGTIVIMSGRQPKNPERNSCTRCGLQVERADLQISLSFVEPKPIIIRG